MFSLRPRYLKKNQVFQQKIHPVISSPRNNVSGLIIAE
jgi:hypothetical protein